MALLRTPFDRTGLDTEVLSAEPQAALVARDHQLARQPRLTAADLAAQPVVGVPADDARTAPAAQASDLAQLLEAVALGQVMAVGRKQPGMPAYALPGRLVHDRSSEPGAT